MENTMRGVNIILEGLEKAYQLPKFEYMDESMIADAEDAEAFAKWYAATHPIVNPDVRRAIQANEPY